MTAATWDPGQYLRYSDAGAGRSLIRLGRCGYVPTVVVDAGAGPGT